MSEVPEVTWHSVGRGGNFFLVAMEGEKEVFVMRQAALKNLTNVELVKIIRKKDFYSEEQDPAIIWRGEITRNPEAYAMKWNPNR